MSPFKKKNKVPQVDIPRSLEDIIKEYNQECHSLGQVEYQIFVLRKDVEQRSLKIQQLNYEADKRKRLDAEAAKQAEATKAAQPEATDGQV